MPGAVRQPVANDTDRSEHLRSRQRKPDASDTHDCRQTEECRNKEHHAAQKGKHYGRPGFLHALEIAYCRKVEDKENESRGKERNSPS